jgi:hypothetical protein
LHLLRPEDKAVSMRKEAAVAEEDLTIQMIVGEEKV